MTTQNKDPSRVFLTMFNQIVVRVWKAHPDNRVDVAYSNVRKIFRPVNSDVLQRIANTALRVVAFAEAWHDQMKDKHVP